MVPLSMKFSFTPQKYLPFDIMYSVEFTALIATRGLVTYTAFSAPTHSTVASSQSIVNSRMPTKVVPSMRSVVPSYCSPST